MSIKYLLPLLLLLGCAPDGSENQPKQVVMRQAPGTKTNTIQAKAPQQGADFDRFMQQFIASYDFQDAHCRYPFLSITCTDPIAETYDTLLVKQTGSDAVALDAELFRADHYFYETRFPNVTTALVTVRQEDTGIHVAYTFKLTDKGWELTGILDEST